MVSLLICVIVTAVIFDYINGFHDAANAIATVVSTGVLPVRTAVIIAGILNFVGAVTGTAVAKTIASGFADPAIVTQTVSGTEQINPDCTGTITYSQTINSQPGPPINITFVVSENGDKIDGLVTDPGATFACKLTRISTRER